jgi:hypothetical protein
MDVQTLQSFEGFATLKANVKRLLFIDLVLRHIRCTAKRRSSEGKKAGRIRFSSKWRR